MEDKETCYKLDENKPETCPGNCKVHGEKGVTMHGREETQPLSRAEKRRFKREEAKAKNPPKYGPVIIFREVHEEVHEEGQRGVKFKKSYEGRTNIKHLAK